MAPAPADDRVAAFFSGGVDSWSTVLGNPDVTDLIFVRGFDLVPGAAHQEELGKQVEARLREAATDLGRRLHVVDTNLRHLSDGLVPWEAFYASALVSVALFFEDMFERVLITGDTDHETQVPIGSSRMVDQLWSTERLEIASDGGRLNREERLRRIVDHPVVQRTLRICWQNPGGAYNCGRCRKCMLTKTSLEALGARHRVTTFPPEFDLDLLAGFEPTQRIQLALWEDLLDTVRDAGRPDLERAVVGVVARGKRALGLPPDHRGRHLPGPAPTVRVAAVVPAWRQARYLASAVQSVLDQEIACGVGVVIVEDGCPDPETRRIGQALRDAHPDRVAYLRQPNRGVSAARNAGIRQAFARWPHVEAVFPLDADNMLSPHTLAKLSALLDEHPEAAWASPTLEFFGAEEGEWQIPGPYLPYRQLFDNQSDAGSLIRRSVFEAGIEYDETMRYGFEDWELFLRATLAGFSGLPAGRCGFRYRRRVKSMLTAAQQRREIIEAEIRSRHPGAYEPAALVRREHAEAPRFALVRCDRGDVLLTAGCDLEPRQLSLADFARSIAAAGDAEPAAGDHVPAITVLSTAATVERLDAVGLLADTLFRLQTALRGRTAVGLEGDGTKPSALAVRAGSLPRLAGATLPEPEALVEVSSGTLHEPLPQRRASAAAALIGTAAQSAGLPLPATAHPNFFEYHHIEMRRTTFPLSRDGPHRSLDTIAGTEVEAA